jgi:hypothetical protein
MQQDNVREFKKKLYLISRYLNRVGDYMIQRHEMVE